MGSRADSSPATRHLLGGIVTGPACSRLAAAPYSWPVYDHDPEDVASLGWEEFVARQWESIFTGYRSWTGLRKMGRRWCDLVEAGLGCTQEIADELVRVEVIDRPDRDLEGTRDVGALVAGMAGVLADMGADLTEMSGLGPEVTVSLLEQHAKLVSFIHTSAFGHDTGQAGT